ncbi:MAG: carboxylating nicotinate-nucleotide diphosphorylase [Xenococcus sp. MO_188.B8]|nr:carboxylating nicotinate-nucleotide diphosphorylase [Xenococcus sp. MO_188.B8]
MEQTIPSRIVLESLLRQWLLEDIGRGDVTTQGLLLSNHQGRAEWFIKENGIVAGLTMASQVFELLDRETIFTPTVAEGQFCSSGTKIAEIAGNIEALLSGERTALNLAMRLSGIATATKQYVEKINDLPAKLVDTRKTTPGLRILEKYATRVGGAVNHRLGLDDAVMIKDNHIRAIGGIEKAIAIIRGSMPYPLTIEVETSSLDEVQDAIEHGADIIMLDNMSLEMMTQAVKNIRAVDRKITIEASGNITLERINAVAQTGVDYISSSAPVTRSHWLDLSMRFL